MTLSLVQMLPSNAALVRYAHRAGLPDADPGYLWHRALRDAFGAIAPQPFRMLDGAGRPPRLLGYTAADHDHLRAALALAPPDLDAVFPLEDIASKPLPLPFGVASRLAFETRVCPVVRTSVGTGSRKRELDAFVHHAETVRDEPKPDREAVYCSWLATRLEDAGARLMEARMEGFRLLPLVRRRHARRGATEGEGKAFQLLAQGKRAARRPEVIFKGVLEVIDADRFGGCLARGIGRHRAFGYGMLLLSRA